MFYTWYISEEVCAQVLGDSLLGISAGMFSQFFFFFFLFILRWMGKNKAEAHHTSTYFSSNGIDGATVEIVSKCQWSKGISMRENNEHAALGS